MELRREHVLGQIQIADVVHVAVEIQVAVGHRKAGLLRERDGLRGPGQGGLRAGDDALNHDPVLIREDGGAGGLIHQRPEGAAPDQHLAVLCDDLVIPGEEHVHGLPGPGPDGNPLVIDRHPADGDPLQGDDPQKTPVQGLVPAHAQFLRVGDGALLEHGQQHRGPQPPIEVHVRVPELVLLLIDFHGYLLTRFSMASTTSPSVWSFCH